MRVQHISLPMSDYEFRDSVSTEEFNAALIAMTRAIAVKDTPEEWAKFTGQSILLLSKIAISHFGFGPAITLIEQIFGDQPEVVALIKLLGEVTNEDS